MASYLIATIPQADGGVRELYASTRSEARAAQERIRADRAQIDALRPSEWVDVASDGRRTRYVRAGGAS